MHSFVFIMAIPEALLRQLVLERHDFYDRIPYRKFDREPKKMNSLLLSVIFQSRVNFSLVNIQNVYNAS